MNLNMWLVIGIVIPIIGLFIICITDVKSQILKIIEFICSIASAIVVTLNILVLVFLMVLNQNSNGMYYGDIYLYKDMFISGDDKGQFDIIEVSKKEKIRLSQYIFGLTNYNKILDIKVKSNTSEFKTSSIEVVDRNEDDEIGLRVNSGSKYDVFIKVNNIYYNIGDVKTPSNGVEYRLIYANDSYEKNGNVESYNKCKLIRNK